MPITILNTTTTPPPRLPYEEVCALVLGRGYDLSLVFVGDTRSRTLNRNYRKKDAPASVLSFPLEPTAGEIYISVPVATRRKSRYGGSLKDCIGHYFIHGLLHLKGYDHGGTMDRREEEIARQFGIRLPY